VKLLVIEIGLVGLSLGSESRITERIQNPFAKKQTLFFEPDYNKELAIT